VPGNHHKRSFPNAQVDALYTDGTVAETMTKIFNFDDAHLKFRVASCRLASSKTIGSCVDKSIKQFVIDGQLSVVVK